MIKKISGDIKRIYSKIDITLNTKMIIKQVSIVEHKPLKHKILGENSERFPEMAIVNVNIGLSTCCREMKLKFVQQL